ncbi:SU10 major capsid protein [Tessaracoccus sp.]
MAGVSGQGTTFNLPNYHGQLYAISPVDTPFLSVIGALSLANGGANGRDTNAIDFEWQGMDRRTSTSGNAALEGANAPTGAARSRTQYKNTVEIHQSAVEISYTKQAASGNYSGVNISGQPDDNVLSELDTQVTAELQSMAIDVELSFLTGTYARPVDNATARKTQGVLGAAGTVNANGGTPRAVTKALMDATVKSIFDAGGHLPQATTVLMVGSAQKIALSNLYNSTAQLNQPTMTRNIGGFALDTVVTDFGTFGVMLNRWMPAGQIGFVNLAVCRPVWLAIPGKGRLFAEPLAKVGAADKWQLYGEVGLEYGPPTEHGILKDLS